MMEEIYKSRSSAACISASTNYLFKNLKSIFRKMWLPILVVALLTGFYQKECIDLMLGVTMDKDFPGNVLFLAIWLVFLTAAAFWYEAAIISFINGRSILRNMKRLGILLLSSIGVGILLGASCIGVFFLLRGDNSQADMGSALSSTISALVVSVVLLILILLLMIPLYQFMMKYLIEDKPFLPSLTQGYREGLRHYGKIFLAILLIGIIVSVFYFIFNLPMHILIGAQTANFNGMQMGDASSLPSNFTLLCFLASCLGTSLLLAFCYIWTFLSLAFVYGSITFEEQERRNMKENQQSQMTAS